MANRQVARSCEPPACFRNPEWWTKGCTVRSKKKVIGWIFKQLLATPLYGTQREKYKLYTLGPVFRFTHGMCPLVIQEISRQTFVP